MVGGDDTARPRRQCNSYVIIDLRQQQRTFEGQKQGDQSWRFFVLFLLFFCYLFTLVNFRCILPKNVVFQVLLGGNFFHGKSALLCSLDKKGLGYILGYFSGHTIECSCEKSICQ
jgi:hypothetical protein